MHIPDNFLSTPVWATLDAVSIPAVGFMVRRAGRRKVEDTSIPLLGVMGAFVFAAQMINFPVGIGTSGHLVGGALLAFTLGPAPATIVMTAIIAIQAFVFQDGGVLALGANVFNMAVAGVLAGYLPFWMWGARRRRPAIFIGAFLSVMVSGSLALGEAADFRRRNAAAVGASVYGSVCDERADRRRDNHLRVPSHRKAQSRLGSKARGNELARPLGVERHCACAGIGGISAGLVGAGWDPAPGHTARLGGQRTGFHAPFADYTAGHFDSAWLRRATAGLTGLLVVYAVCVAFAKMIGRRRSA